MLNYWTIAFFFVYNNDIVNLITFVDKCVFFADDTSIYTFIDDPNTSTFILDSDFEGQ